MLLRYGSEAQKAAFLCALWRQASSIFVFGMSEPDSGSDLGIVKEPERRADAICLVGHRFENLTSHCAAMRTI